MADNPRPTSVLSMKSQQSGYSDIADAPLDVQLSVYRETLADLERFLDTGDLTRLTVNSLGSIRDDVLNIISGIRNLRNFIPIGSVTTVDGTLDQLRNARNQLQVAIQLFDSSGKISQSNRVKLYSRLNDCRTNFEKAYEYFSPITGIAEETPAQHEPSGAHFVGFENKPEPEFQDESANTPGENFQNGYGTLKNITMSEVETALSYFQPQLTVSANQGWIATNYFCVVPIKSRRGPRQVFGRVGNCYPVGGMLENIREFDLYLPRIDAVPLRLRINGNDIDRQRQLQSYHVAVRMHLSQDEAEDFSRSENTFLEQGFAPLYDTGYVDLLDTDAETQRSRPWLSVFGSRWYAAVPVSMQSEVAYKLGELSSYSTVLNYHPAHYSLQFKTLNEELNFKPGLTEKFLIEPATPQQTLQILNERFDRLFQQPMSAVNQGGDGRRTVPATTPIPARQQPPEASTPSSSPSAGFTEPARKALDIADRLWKIADAEFLSTTHLLAGLYLLEGDSPAFCFLSVLGIDRKKLLGEVLGTSIDENQLNEVLSQEQILDMDSIQLLAVSDYLSHILEQLQQEAEVSHIHLFMKSIEDPETAASTWLVDTLGEARCKWIRQKMQEDDVNTNYSITKVQGWAAASGFYKPPTGMDDEATVEDLLDFKRYTNALASIILKPETHPPLVVGVYGPWGAGKSTFLRLIKEHLSPTPKIKEERSRRSIREIFLVWYGKLLEAFKKVEAPELVVIEYNAWEYTDAPKLWSGLVAKIAGKIDEKLGWRGRLAYLLKRHSRRIWGAVILGLIPVLLFLITLYSGLVGDWLKTNPVITGWLTALSTVVWSWYTYLLQKDPVSTIVKALTEKFDSTPVNGVIHNIQEELESAINIKLMPETSPQHPEITRQDVVDRVRSNQFKIVVLIDELDRCPLERIVDILEAIKLFLAERIFIVLIAIDTRVAAEAIRLHYKDVENPDLPREYLEKIVQLPLQVPTADNPSIRKYLTEHMPNTGSMIAGANRPTGNAEQQNRAPTSDQNNTPISVPPIAAQRKREEPRVRSSGQQTAVSISELPDTPVEFDQIAVVSERFLESNPRRIKRLLNTYRYIKVLFSSQVNVYAEDWQRQMLSWLAFTMRWPAFMNKSIEIATSRKQNRVAANKNRRRKMAEVSDQPFLTGVTKLVGTKLERPTVNEIGSFLSIDEDQVLAFAKQASNFLIETPVSNTIPATKIKRPSSSRKTRKTTLEK